MSARTATGDKTLSPLVSKGSKDSMVEETGVNIVVQVDVGEGSGGSSSSNDVAKSNASRDLRLPSEQPPSRQPTIRERVKGIESQIATEQAVAKPKPIAEDRAAKSTSAKGSDGRPGEDNRPEKKD